MHLNRVTSFLIAALAVLVAFAAIRAPASAHPPQDNPLPKFTLKDPCALDPKNLINNGSMGAGDPADGWSRFVLDGSPSIEHVDNEQIDPYGSVEIVSTGTFDAGIMQTVSGLQPGVYYGFRLGYSLAAKSINGPNERVDSIGRQVGVDPFGGSDPKSSNVIWGPAFFNGKAALNIPEMQLIFAARAPAATIFLRAIARDASEGENRVWLDAVCMQAQNDMPTATPEAPTATPVTPTPTETATRPAPTRAPATKVPTATNTAIPESISPPHTPTPTTVVLVAAEPVTSELRYARPYATPAPSAPIDAGHGALVGLGTMMVAGGLVSLGIGIFLWRRVV